MRNNKVYISDNLSVKMLIKTKSTKKRCSGTKSPVEEILALRKDQTYNSRMKLDETDVRYSSKFGLFLHGG